MTELAITLRSGETRRVAFVSGQTLMEVIRDAGIDEMMALCGGCCSCATCHVHVDTKQFNWLPSMSADEDDLLDSSDNRTATSRLACQIALTEGLDGLRVTIGHEE